MVGQVRFAGLVVVLAVMAGCGSKRASNAIDVGSPSLDEGRRLFANTDVSAVGRGFSSLGTDPKQQWAAFLDAHAAELKGSGQTVDSFCATTASVGAALAARDASRWNQLLSACNGLVAEIDLQAKNSQRRAEADRAVKDAEAELKKLNERAQALKREKDNVIMFDGFIVQRLDAHTYEVAEAQMTNGPARPCYGAADCNAAEFSRMGNPAVRPSEDRGILKTKKAVFESEGRFSLMVRVKGTEKRTNKAGFKQEVVVLEEADGGSDAGDEMKRLLKRSDEIVADSKKWIAVLSETEDPDAGARLAEARRRVETLLACLAAGKQPCASEAHRPPGGPAVEDRNGTAGELPKPPGPPTFMTVDAVRVLANAHAASLTTNEFGNSFADDAVAFFPHSLRLVEGRAAIKDASHEAWGRQGTPVHVDASEPLVQVWYTRLALMTSQWRITLADRKTIVPVRVTEVVEQNASGIHVIAASFSVAPPPGTNGIGEPAPTIASGAAPARDPDSWLASPLELAKHLHNDGATVVIGSEADELALGADAASKMLGEWKNVKLEFVGNVKSNEGAGFRTVAGYVRWRGRSTLFRVFALFVSGDLVDGEASWELATAHYSVAEATP